MTTKLYLSIGEVDGDRIGCYLFGIEATPVSPVLYHSVATSPAELLSDCTNFFHELAASRTRLAITADLVDSASHKHHLKVIQNMIENLSSFIAMHLTSDMTEPFLRIGPMSIFLRTGMRQREKFNGFYIE